jgi:SdiA-regulated
MKKNRYCFLQVAIVLACMMFFSNCNTAKTYTSPAGYDFGKPEKLIMETALQEISGICFLPGNDGSLFAIEDESGKLYQYNLADGKLTKSKFGKKGDYEDVSILNNQAASVLSSDGSIFLFAASDASQEKIDSVQEYKNILPAGEYEGLFAADSTLYALCKDCPQDKPSREVSIFELGLVSGSGLSVTKTYKADVSGIQVGEGKEKIKFHPSAMAKNTVTNDWFLLSSSNKMLLQFDEQWKLKSYFQLDPSLFKQPEGMAFNSKGDLYISNEGGTGAANILIFRYLPK